MQSGNLTKDLSLLHFGPVPGLALLYLFVDFKLHKEKSSKFSFTKTRIKHKCR